MGLQGLGFAFIEWNPNGPAPKSFSLGLDWAWMANPGHNPNLRVTSPK